MKKIKQLQKDITTPEQAEKLLELGVPKVTANYYYDSRDFKPQAHGVRGHWNEEDWQASIHGYKISPCWSVGRLMEIYYISRDAYSIEYEYYHNTNMIDDMIRRFEIQKGKLDFSKLED